ncbi:hypothetical protein [Glutamicibacter protophormiae]|uniref:Uncharacterized protein n=1 Tax=Glutamicibacter protophormiae TaxID=37930 RepID=A0ABS4XTU8_GLUPR|nr:hypothetical protein [Glutamicibacter protophormiae]MBP2399780.1 hypothetical protein [Glutamicibacter protophormiae]GGL89117.1 hypothetical protein GCM10010038_18900 [Glutamicibacter protophormiae]
MYWLDWIKVVENISFNVWSTYMLKGKSKPSMLEVCMDVLRHQYAPAAAAWVISQRGGEVLNVNILNQQLRDGYED